MSQEEELTVTFEPDEALILALNEINSLRELVAEQTSAIEDLKKDLLEIKKPKPKHNRDSEVNLCIILFFQKNQHGYRVVLAL